METMAQRIEALRTERNMSRPALAAALQLPKNAVEKWETGRQSPTKEQAQKLADYFGVSIFYLRGESNDRTRQDTWMEGGFTDDEGQHRPIKPKAAPPSQPVSSGQGTIFDSFLKSRAFQDMLQETIKKVLLSPEGKEIIEKAISRKNPD